MSYPGIFERLENQKPTISNKKLQEDRAKNLNILRFLGKYPNGFKGSYDSTTGYIDRDTKQRLNSTAYNRGYDVE